MSAFGAMLFCRLVPGCKLALRIVGAAVKYLACFGFTLDNIAAAVWAFYADFFQYRLGIAALRKTGARQKLAVAAELDHHLPAALLADDAFIAYSLVAAAMTFPVLGRSENLFAEKTIAFWFLSTIVDGFRL